MIYFQESMKKNIRTALLFTTAICGSLAGMDDAYEDTIREFMNQGKSRADAMAIAEAMGIEAPRRAPAPRPVTPPVGAPLVGGGYGIGGRAMEGIDAELAGLRVMRAEMQTAGEDLAQIDAMIADTQARMPAVRVPPMARPVAVGAPVVAGDVLDVLSGEAIRVLAEEILHIRTEHNLAEGIGEEIEQRQGTLDLLRGELTVPGNNIALINTRIAVLQQEITGLEGLQRIGGNYTAEQQRQFETNPTARERLDIVRELVRRAAARGSRITPRVAVEFLSETMGW